MLSSLCWPSKEEDGYMFVPIPSLRPVSFAIASWSPGIDINWGQALAYRTRWEEFTRNFVSNIPVIILTFTPKLRALRMVSALSCLGGSKRGNKPTNCHGAPGLSLVFSGTSCLTYYEKQQFQRQLNHQSSRYKLCYGVSGIKPVLQQPKIEVHARQTCQLQKTPSSWSPLCSCKESRSVPKISL